MAGSFTRRSSVNSKGAWVLARVQRYVREHPGSSRTQVYLACKADVVWLGRHQPDDLDWIWCEIPKKRAKQACLSFDGVA